MTISDVPETEPILSVVIPVFNEVGTLDQILAAVAAVDLDLEIIAVDDGSRDGSRHKLKELVHHFPRLRVLYHDRNQGKGAALRTGFAAAQGRFVVVQDADLEYDPAEFPKLLQPLIDGEADVVYGSRFLETSQRSGALTTSHRLANRFLTLLSNQFTRLHLTDMETCYKVFPRRVIQGIPIEENRFGFEPEVTARIARLRVDGRPLRIREVGISYDRRRSDAGKKLSWKDGLRAVWCIFKYARAEQRQPPC